MNYTCESVEYQAVCGGFLLQMTENWTKVEEKYINDPFQAYLSGSVQAESVLPAELILQLIARMDVIEKGLMRKLKVR